ncbi:hypothetical protein [Paenibacillus taichungensis]|uniref:hypothetical protein n=1 Tax=Paenibacillus taichungensis TaxID=484184 RepID=UPI0039A2E56E
MPIFLILIAVVVIIAFPLLSFIVAGGIASIVLAGIPILLGIMLVSYVFLKLFVAYFDFKENKPLRLRQKAEKENRKLGLITNEQFKSVSDYNLNFGLNTNTTYLNMSRKQKRTVLLKMIEQDPTNDSLKKRLKSI